jgi:hypothetical protein
MEKQRRHCARTAQSRTVVARSSENGASDLDVTTYRWRERLRPKRSTEIPNTEHAAAAPRADDDSPTSHLHPGLAMSAWAKPEYEEMATTVENTKRSARMYSFDTNRAEPSREEFQNEQEDNDHHCTARHDQDHVMLF